MRSPASLLVVVYSADLLNAAIPLAAADLVQPRRERRRLLAGLDAVLVAVAVEVAEVGHGSALPFREDEQLPAAVVQFGGVPGCGDDQGVALKVRPALGIGSAPGCEPVPHPDVSGALVDLAGRESLGIAISDPSESGVGQQAGDALRRSEERGVGERG